MWWAVAQAVMSQSLVLTLMTRKVKAVKNNHVFSPPPFPLPMLHAYKTFTFQENLNELQPCWEAFLGPEGGGVCPHPLSLVSSNFAMQLGFLNKPV